MASAESMITSFFNRRSQSCSATEYRLLQPICSSFRTPKAAILRCDKIIKAQKNYYIFHALRAVATTQLSKPLSNSHKSEIIAIAEFLEKDAEGAGLADPDILGLFAWTARALSNPGLVVKMLGEATKRHPSNEDVLLEAFVYYLREGMHDSTEVIGNRLRLICPDVAKYTWWTISTLLLMSSNALTDPSTVARLTITAGHINVGRQQNAIARKDPEAIDEGRGKGKGKQSIPLLYSSIHEFHLVARYLQLKIQVASISAPLNEHALKAAKEEMLGHFNGPEGDIWCEKSLGAEIWRRETELEYGSLSGGDWMRAWERLKLAVDAGNTNWHTMLYLIRNAIQLCENSPPEVADELLRRTIHIFRDLANSDKKERGYLLGLLEISKIKSLSSASLIIEYFDTFGSKMCFFDDVRPYLQGLLSNPGLPIPVFEHVDTFIMNHQALSADNIQKYISASKLHRYMRGIASLSIEQEEEISESFLLRYHSGLYLGKDLPVTELQPADDLALLSAQAYVLAYQSSNDRSHLEKALAVLTFALNKSTYKYQLRILTILVYRLLGTPSLALVHYKLLGVKSVQFETLSHLVFNRATTFAVGGNDIGVLGEMEAALKWYNQGEAEASEMLVQAMMGGSYSRIEEFATFARGIEYSLAKCLLRMEAIRMRVIRGTVAEISDLTNDFIAICPYIPNRSDPLREHRDFETLPNLQPMGADDIWRATETGPRISYPWLLRFKNIYSRMLVPSESVEPLPIGILDTELTEAEQNLEALSMAVTELYGASLEDGKAAENSIIHFFKHQKTMFDSSVIEDNKLPWELLHFAEIAFEGYCLLDLSTERKTSELSKTKPIDHAARGKLLRTLRNTAREIVRDLGVRVNAYSKQVAKQRGKMITNLGSLRISPIMDDEYISNFSHSLIEAKKMTAEALAAGIIRRCAK